MLARLHVLLPYVLAVPTGERFEIHEYELNGYKVRYYPPKRSDNQPGDSPDEVQIDGVPAIQANVLHVDFAKDSFDRSEDRPCDPSYHVIGFVVNDFLTRLRYTTRAGQIRPVPFPQITWRLKYLNDDGTELEKQEGFVRMRGGWRQRLRTALLTVEVWNNLLQLPPNFEPPAWVMLLLDAKEALPEVGPAVVLAMTALEVLVSHSLDELAKESPIPAPLWQWINDRGPLFKNPSTEDQYDLLLRILIGTSLKEDTELWNAFKNLKKARNTFAHGGVAKIGNTPIDVSEGAELINKATEIVAWIHSKLPQHLQWPEYTYSVNMVMKKQIPIAEEE